ncbi:MAG: type I 3-dehydroquinate dehydratase [Motiliproteus sp.]
MSTGKLVKIKGQAIAAGKHPLICAPLVATNTEDLVAEASRLVAKGPDLIEWRVDFFNQIANSASVIATAKQIKATIGDIPLLFTRRAEHEGGEPIEPAEEQVVAMYAEVLASGCVDLIDYELSHQPVLVKRLVGLAKQYQTPIILSYHNFQQTPSIDEIVERLLAAEAAGADVAKVAVMPNSKKDVLTLLTATEEASNRLSIPLITMSMGSFGALSRLIGGAFGSAVTFAVGETSSAPGQMAIKDVAAVVEILHRKVED